MKGNDYQEKSASVILSKPTKIIRIKKIKYKRRRGNSCRHLETIFAFGKRAQ